MSLDIFRSKPALRRHGLSLLISLIVHAGLIYFLVIHFVSVKIINFKEKVTPVLLVPPEKLQLPKMEGNLPNPQDWGAQFPELAPGRARAQRKATATGAIESPPETILGPPVDSKLTSQFSLTQTPQEKEELSPGRRQRFTFPMSPKTGSGGAPTGTAAAPSRDLRQYIYTGPSAGGRGSSVGAYSGGRGGRASVYGRAAAPPLVKNFDLSSWARAVIELIQKNWSIPPAQIVRTEDTVEIAVVILKNGQIFSAAIVSPSNNTSFDQAALDAVEGSVPLPPLPGDFPAASVEISLVFAQQW